MGYFIIAILSALALVNCNDIRLSNGYAGSQERRIFQQKYDYSPSIYTRSESVVVNAPPNEHISRIDVIDMRELKDGIATISTGGVGDRTVKIELSGPAVFRGMTFYVSVYAVADSYTGNSQPYVYQAKTSPYQYDTQQQYSGDYRYPNVKQ